MASFFDPGHGFLSSADEIAVALLALVFFVVVGSVAEYLGDAKGGMVLGALVGYVAVLLYWAPPVFANEWHYALVAAVPVAVLVYFYRGRRDRS
ncbi:hypothetical protein AUR64_05965 [Haloprofundus marisrubri]|uniref:Uncharacterized protein n=1 Tax=Haloprofundus marisrubri TaxID=1514971 RepID=A0A0W1RBE9_9EURY|nr:hypothetical protein [Haloprofundus marisrubri]KTG10736.1 hypothetical protein AUR64_05965 [Haloprofundus marisrubri]